MVYDPLGSIYFDFVVSPQVTLNKDDEIFLETTR